MLFAESLDYYASSSGFHSQFYNLVVTVIQAQLIQKYIFFQFLLVDIGYFIKN